jgi:hypothetical protein
MTPVLDSTAERPKSLTTPQLEVVERVWQLAGWLPVSGYGLFALAAIVAANHTLAATLTSVEFDDPKSVASAVRALHDSREHLWR